MNLREEINCLYEKKYASRNLDENIIGFLGYLGRSKQPEVMEIKTKIHKYMQNVFREERPLSESLYLIMHNLKSFPSCNHCARKVKFRNFKFGYSEYCSAKCVSQATRHKVKEKMMDKYGVEYAFQADEVKEKIKQSNLEKYGVEYVTQAKEVKDKIKDSVMERYGVEYSLQAREVREQIKRTCVEKYGGVAPLCSEDMKEKVRETNREKFGVDYPAQSEIIKDMQSEYLLNIAYDNLMSSEKILDRVDILISREEYVGAKSDVHYEFRCKKCGDVFLDHIGNGRIPRCQSCYPYNAFFGKSQREINGIIRDWGIQTIENDRQILHGKELDIYIPSHNLAIEFNGLYWHSEISGNKDKYYHLDKTKLAEKHGMTLLHIFEDEWINKKDLVVSMIKHRLGLTNNRIYARKCNVERVNRNVAIHFLNDNHIQGSVEGKHLGLVYNGTLVGLLTMGKPRFNKKYDWEILRYCILTDCAIVGGFSKLLSYFRSNFEVESIVTYADRRYSTGMLYEQSGFEFVDNTKPAYFYIKDYSRMSRFKFQKHRLPMVLESFDSNLTEWQNMQLNGYDRIWDCGCKVYESSYN